MNDYAHKAFAPEDLLMSEAVGVNNILSEMNGLSARFLEAHATTGADGAAISFAANSTHVIEDWNGNGSLVTINGAAVPKLLVEPAPDTVAQIRRYDVRLAGQRRAVERNKARLGETLPPRERERLTDLLVKRQRIYSQMWVRQMMYNRFDTEIKRWTDHYNAEFSPSTDLDPNIPKSIFFQESRMGTSGFHLELPPYSWTDPDTHPIRSRYNLGQAIDSYGQQQWLMIREMAPAIATRNGLDDLAHRAVWKGMSSEEYSAHAGFLTALREFFEARSGGDNLMGSGDKDLHLDYGFWIRTAIRWLFEKYKGRTWPDAVRAYNGGGASADRYKREVMARVGSDEPITPSEQLPAEADFRLEDSGPSLSSGARLTWESLTRTPNARGQERLYYVVSGAPNGVDYATFNLRVQNTNDHFNHQNVATKVRLLQKPRNRPHVTVYPDPSTGSGWNVKSQPDLEDEASRIIPVRFPFEVMQRAYNSDWPLARVELEYHWREIGQSRQAQYARTGLDFYLVSPIEWMFSRRRYVGEFSFNRLPSNDPAEFKRRFWLFVQGVDFDRHISGDAQITFNVASQVSRGAQNSSQQSMSQSQTRSNSSSTTTGFSLTTSVGASREASAGASVEIFELGIKNMMEVGLSQTFSQSVSRSRTNATTSELASSVSQSQSYQRSQTISSQAAFSIGRPSRGLSTASRNRSQSIGVYLYPIVDYYEVPYVRFSNVNEFGQATRREEGSAIIPFVREWRLITSDR